jgi:hypothetical protein
MGGQQGIHQFIDFASLLCENPRKRRLLRGKARAPGANHPLQLSISDRKPMDLFQYRFQYHGKHAGSRTTCGSGLGHD